MSGLFLSFEGGEASGKSVQARALADWLRANGNEAVLTREPGGTPLGERVRDILLHQQDVPLTPEAQALLFSASRAQLARDIIRPALAAGSVVIADRFYDSTLAYQGYGHGLAQEGLARVTKFAVGDLVPHRTFLLDLPVEISFARSEARRGGLKRWDRFEADAREFHERLRAGYLELAQAEPNRIVVVDGDRNAEVISEEIRRSVSQLLVLSRG